MGTKKIARPRVQNAALTTAAVLVAGVALGIHLRFGSEAITRLTSGSTFDHFDFETFWYSAKALWEKRGIYYDTGHGAVSANPPLFTVLISPLGLLEGIVAYKVYALTMLWISVGYLAWTAEELKLRAGWAIGGTVALLLSMPMLTTLSLGQMYPLLALGLVAAWVADRRGKAVASGVALGVVVTLKPSLMPVLLWPLVRRRWNTLGASVASAAAVLVAGAIVVGPYATLDWLRFVASRGVDEVWTNASLPGQAERLFTENGFAEPVAVLPWMVPVAFVVGVGLIVLSTAKARRDPEMGLWALVVASLLASPVAWENYLVLLGPGILLLVGRGGWAVALLLIALQAFPSEWRLIWEDANDTVEALALTLYCLAGIVHWFVFMTFRGEPTAASEVGREVSSGRRAAAKQR